MKVLFLYLIRQARTKNRWEAFFISVLNTIDFILRQDITRFSDNLLSA